MISTWTIYWIGILDDLKTCFLNFSEAGIFVSIVMWFITGAYTSEGTKYIKHFVISSLCVTLCAIGCKITAHALPSTKLAASMVIIPVIANNEKLQNIGSNTLKGLELLTKEWLKELQTNNKP